MQEMFRIAGLVVCAAVVVDLLKHYNLGYAILAALACCIAILVGTAHLLAPVIEQVKRFTEQAGSENLFYVLKTIGIAVISQCIQDLCTQAGQPALAGRVDFAGRVLMLAAALPLFAQAVELVSNILALS